MSVIFGDTGLALLMAVQAKEPATVCTQTDQRQSWDVLEKEVRSKVALLSRSNIKEIVFGLFKLDLTRGRGVLVNELLKAKDQLLAASLVCVLNSKIPAIGKLMVKRLVFEYKSSKDASSITLLGQLVNFQVASPLLAIQILVVLLETPNYKNIDLVYQLLNTCGRFLLDEQADSVERIYQRLRVVISEGLVDQKAAMLIQKCMQVRKLEFETCEYIPDELDLVEDNDTIVHRIFLNDDIDPENTLDSFHFDNDFQQHHDEYLKLRNDIIGEEEDETEEAEEEKSETTNTASENSLSDVKDYSDAALLKFQKTVYLTVMSSLGPEEAVHKLLKIPPLDPDRKEFLMVDMLLKCCTQEKTYSKFYGLIGEELIVRNNHWKKAFDEVFTNTYQNCDKFETSLLRNIGKFWGHMLASDKMGWEIFGIVKLTEEDTTSSGRIFLKFLFQRMLEELGTSKLLSRLNESYIQESLEGIFPNEDPEHLRFSINYFTAIGMGNLTDRMRSRLRATQLIEDGSTKDPRSRSPTRTNVAEEVEQERDQINRSEIDPRSYDNRYDNKNTGFRGNRGGRGKRGRGGRGRGRGDYRSSNYRYRNE